MVSDVESDVAMKEAVHMRENGVSAAHLGGHLLRVTRQEDDGTV